ncbi:MAG: hypothetical protein RL662_600, partial [Bacteroidota bacterium]
NLTNNVLDFSKSSKLVNFTPSSGGHQGTFSDYAGHVILPSVMTTVPAFSFKNFKGSVQLPPKLEVIGGWAFEWSTIKEITLPATVRLIESSAFQNCLELAKITSNNPTPPALGTNVFYGVNKETCGLFVPSASVSKYASADQWKDFLRVNDLTPKKIKLHYTEDGGKTTLSQYEGVRVGEYYWMNNNFNNPLDVAVTKKQIDYVHDVYGMFDKSSKALAASDNRTYWNYLGEQKGIPNPTEAQIEQILLPEFHKYYGTYYTMNRDRINKLGAVRRLGSIKEEVNGELVGKDSIRHYWDGLRAVVHSKYWDLPTAADVLQLIGMCGHGTMPEVRQYLSYRENEVPVAIFAPGMGWFTPHPSNFVKPDYPADIFDVSNTNKYGMNIVPGGLRWGVFQDSVRSETEHGSQMFYNVPQDEFLGAGLNQALVFPVVTKTVEMESHNVESRIFAQFELGDHPVINYFKYPVPDSAPMRWCRALSDEELGYKLYINQDMTSVKDTSFMIIYADKLGYKNIYITRSGEELLLEKVRKGIVKKENISIIKLGLNDAVPTGFVELPRGYIRGFYVQYILDNPNPSKTITNLIDIALVNKNLWVRKDGDKIVTPTIKSKPITIPTSTVAVYPNPVSEVLNIAGDNIQKVELYDLTGRLVKQVEKANSLSVTELKAGMYIVKVSTASGVTNHKVIKK